MPRNGLRNGFSFQHLFPRLYFRPTFIHLITMKKKHPCSWMLFWIFRKISPESPLWVGLVKLISPKFKPTSALVLPHGCFLDFFCDSENSPMSLLWTGPPKLNPPILKVLALIWLRLNFLRILLFFLVGVSWNFSKTVNEIHLFTQFTSVFFH